MIVHTANGVAVFVWQNCLSIPEGTHHLEVPTCDVKTLHAALLHDAPEHGTTRYEAINTGAFYRVWRIDHVPKGLAL